MTETKDLKNELWDLFDKLSDKEKVDWLSQFDIIFDIIREWDEEILKEQIKEMKNYG